MKLRSKAAQLLSRQLEELMKNREFVEARLWLSHAVNEEAHVATLYLYCEHNDEDVSDNIFRGDDSEYRLDLNLFESERDNKIFIASLKNQLPLVFRYMSNQISFGWNRAGFEQTSDRFDFNALLNLLPIDKIENSLTTSATKTHIF